MNAEFVNPFIGGLLNVLETMAQTTLTPGKPKKKADDFKKISTYFNFSRSFQNRSKSQTAFIIRGGGPF